MSIYQWTNTNYKVPKYNEKLDFSQEIQDIVKELLYGNYQIIRVNSLAGTGKTTLLNILSKYYIAIHEAQRSNLHYKDPNILYLAYSTRLKEEAANLFDNQVTCDSIIELAKEHTLKYKNIPNYASMNEYKPEIFMKYFHVEYNIASQVSEILNIWLNSYDTEEGIQNYAYNSTFSSQSAILAHTYVTDTRCFEEDTYVTDKFILKEFQLQLRQSEEIILENKLDLLLVDEGQDLSDAALYVFVNFPAKKKVIVGDTNQKIYPHVSTKNALLKDIGNSIEYHLTASYRHSNDVVLCANNILKTYKGSKHFIESKQENKISKIRSNGYIYRWTSGAIEGLLIAKNANIKSLEVPDEVSFLLEFIISLDLIDSKKKPINRVSSVINFVKKNHAKLNNEIGLVEYIKLSLPKELFKGQLAQAYFVLNKYDIETIKSIYFYLEECKDNSNIPETTITSIFKSKGFEFETITVLSDMTDLAKVVADYFILTEQTYKKGEKFDYIGFFGEYIHMKETIYNSNLVSKWTYPINLYYTAITRARDKVIDLSVNNAYITNEELNKAIFAYIKKYKSFRK